jgi:hypothetical protein
LRLSEVLSVDQACKSKQSVKIRVFSIKIFAKSEGVRLHYVDFNGFAPECRRFVAALPQGH